MNIVSKFILVTLSLGVLFVLFFFTFSPNSNSTKALLDFKHITSGVYQIGENNTLKELQIGQGKEKIHTEIFGGVDEIITVSGSYSQNINGDTREISLEPGIYVFNMHDLQNKYSITSNGMQLQNLGPGSFIINTLKSKQNLIFPLNTILNIELQDTQTQENVTTVTLYPHNYLVFNPYNNQYLQNADFLKISQTHTLDYYQFPVYQSSGEITESLIDLLTLKNASFSSDMKKVFSYIQAKYINENKSFNQIIENTISSFPGEKLIKKYYALFLNNEKKQLYYKNLILGALNDLLKNKKKDTDTIQFIVSTMQELQAINTEEYNKMNSIIHSFYITSMISQNNHKNKLINFSQLKSKLNNQNYAFQFESILGIKNIFFVYDFLSEKKLYSEINGFKQEYFEDLGTKNQTDSNTIKNIDYFLFFLEKIILSDNETMLSNSEELIIFFNNYVDISDAYYKKSNSKIKHTGIFINAKILKNIEKNMRESFFEKEDTEKGLLEKKSGFTLNEKNILLLQIGINKLSTLYQENRNILDPGNKNKDKFLVNSYDQYKKKFADYFLALNDYEKYKAEKNKFISGAGGGGTIFDNITVDNSLQVHKAINYLSQFTGLSISNANIGLLSYKNCINGGQNSEETGFIPACYKINNLYIGGKEFSFILIPGDGNEINKIQFKNENGGLESIPGSYILDETQEILKEKYNYSEQEDKYKYDFKNFFVNTFNNQNIVSVPVISAEENPINTLKEEKEISIFKRTQLLGGGGDFDYIKGFFNINYDNILVLQDGNNYSIQLKDAQLTTNIKKNNRNVNYNLTMNASYIFNPSHSFHDIELQLKNLKEKGALLLLGNTISIPGEVSIKKLEEEVKELLTQEADLGSLLQILTNELSESFHRIEYDIKTKNINIHTNYKSKDLNVILNNGKIIYIAYNNKKLYPHSFELQKIGLILDNIK